MMFLAMFYTSCSQSGQNQPLGVILRDKGWTKQWGAKQRKGNQTAQPCWFYHIIFNWKGIFGYDSNALKANKLLFDS